MFTKDDSRGYLVSVEQTEKKMFDFLSGFIDALQDEELKDVLAGIRQDEERHQRLVRQLMQSTG